MRAQSVTAMVAAMCALSSHAPSAAAERCQHVEGLLVEIRKEKNATKERQFELDEREISIAKLEDTFKDRASEFEELRLALEARLDQLEEQLGDQVARLAKTYSAMPPTSASPLLESLEIELATAIMRRMKPKKSAAVLAVMSQTRATRLSRLLALPFNNVVGN